MVNNEEQMLEFIQARAEANIKDRNYFTMTDVLQDAFLMTEERAYQVFKDIMASSKIGTSKYQLIDAYIKMLRSGYGSLEEQINVFGGNKFAMVESSIRIREEKFARGTFFDIMDEILCVPKEEQPELALKFLKYVEGREFEITLDSNKYMNFLLANQDELDKQYERFR